jgi:hypothetical protein
MMSSITSSNTPSQYDTASQWPNDSSTPTLAQPIPPSQPPEIPSALTLVHKNKYILFEVTKKADFLEWHAKTIWSFKHQQRHSEQAIRIAWGHRKQSKVWDFLFEVADKQDGTPKILCRRCDKILQHPAGKGKSGTNLTRTGVTHLKNHLQSQQCIQASHRANLPQISWAQYNTDSRAVLSHILPQFYTHSTNRQ